MPGTRAISNRGTRYVLLTKPVFRRQDTGWNTKTAGHDRCALYEPETRKVINRISRFPKASSTFQPGRKSARVHVSSSMRLPISFLPSASCDQNLLGLLLITADDVSLCHLVDDPSRPGVSDLELPLDK